LALNRRVPVLALNAFTTDSLLPEDTKITGCNNGRASSTTRSSIVSTPSFTDG
jgi:hypothetical protein